MRLKPGVTIDQMTERMQVACAAIEDCYITFDVDCIVTSGDEPLTKHSGRPVAGDTVNAHYLGKAADFSIHGVPPAKRQDLVDMIEQSLGPDFYVEWEAQGTPNEHIHVQFGSVVP